MPKKKEIKTKEKLKTFKFFGFNIKLQTNEEKGSLTYIKIIRELYNNDIHINVSSDRKLTLRTQFLKQVLYNGIRHDVLYGQIIRYTVIDNENWYFEKKKDFQNVEIPTDAFPNPFETDYIFLPTVHRFFIKNNPKISIEFVKQFLEKGIKQVISSEKTIIVNVMQSHDVIDKILNSDSIQRLNVAISYTNDDIGDDADEEIDNMLKAANAGTATLTLISDMSGKLNENSTLIKGFIGLAKDNGNAIATVTNSGKKTVIRTKNYPEKLIIESIDDQTVAQDLLHKQMNENR